VRTRLWKGKHPSMYSHPTVGVLQREIPLALSCTPGPQSVGLDRLGKPLCMKLHSCNLMSQKRVRMEWVCSREAILSYFKQTPQSLLFFPHISPLTQANKQSQKQNSVKKQKSLQRKATKSSLFSLCFILISAGLWCPVHYCSHSSLKLRIPGSGGRPQVMSTITATPDPFLLSYNPMSRDRIGLKWYYWRTWLSKIGLTWIPAGSRI
jgi:hypothetical protein